MLALTGCVRVDNPAPVLPASSASAPEQGYRLAGWCGDVCLGLESWPYQVKDAQLLIALILAYHHAPQWRELAQECAADGAVVRTGAMPDKDTVAYFSAAQNEIVVDPALLAEPNAILAAVLAHEVAHCAQRATGGPSDPVTCFQQELFAVEWEAYVYASLPPSSTWTFWVVEEEARQARWRDGTLGDLVLTTWQDDCLGDNWRDDL